MRKLFFILCVVSAVMPASGQVNFQTGSAVFSLPMFNWQDSKSRLKSVVALSYSSGNGLRVDDIASNVGQGWSLVAGGAIVRIQNGEPDDQPKYDGGSERDIARYPAGALYAVNAPSKGCPTGLTKYPIYKQMNQYYTPRNDVAEDRQLDYFSFQFNGKAGMFVLNPFAGHGDVGQMIGDSRVKISFTRDPSLASQNIRTTITSFTIQDVDGLIYKFTYHGLTQVLHEDYCDASFTAPQSQPKFAGGNVYHQAGFPNSKFIRTQVISSWYLSEIDDPLTHHQILFNYVNKTVNNTAGIDISYNQTKNYTIISHKISQTVAPELSSIVYPDGHTVTFTYGAARADLAGENALSSVDIVFNGRTLSEYQLNTTYFMLNRYGTPTSDYQKRLARLCLRSVKKIGVDLKEDSPPYTFDYYLGSNNADDIVPPPFCVAKDIWGFYNGDQSKDYNGTTIPAATLSTLLNNAQCRGLCFQTSASPGTLNLNPKTNYARNGLLRQIVYPTGGTLTYDYNQNKGVLVSGQAEREIGGVHVIQTGSTDGGFQNGCNNPLATNYYYTLDYPTNATSSLWGLEMPNNMVVSSNHYNSEDKRWHWSWSCPIIGCCYWNFQYPGLLSEMEAISVTSWQKAMEMLAPVFGILTIVTDVMDVVTVAGGATGFFAIAALVVDIIGALLTFGLTCFSGNNSQDNSYIIYYNMDMNGISPLPTQYKRVEVVESGGGGGRTEHDFTSTDDYALWSATNPALSPRQRFAPWAYGLPKATTYYDAGGHVVRQTQNDYNWADYVKETIDAGASVLSSCKCEVLQTSSERNTWWSTDALSFLTNSSAGSMNVDIFPIYTGRVELKASYDRMFNSSATVQAVETATTYTYSPLDYQLQSSTTIRSNGDKECKYIKYVSDYKSLPGAYSMLYNNNVLDEEISEVSLLIPSASSIYTMTVDDLHSYISSTGPNTYWVTGEKATDYIILPDGDIKPSRVFERRFSQPVAAGSFQLYAGPDYIYNSPLTTARTIFYDAIGNPIGSQDEGGRAVTNLYGYLYTYIVATVANADPLLDHPAYTSFEGSTYTWSPSTGGWMPNAGAMNFVDGGVTGSKALNLFNGTLTANINSAKPYTLSFWATTNQVTVPGTAVLVKSAPTINGYTYYEYTIPQGTSSVTVSGTATIDELRLYPRAARMKTTTFDPLIGKTSECDENNRIRYYEYDNLGRLLFIKDENHNALKMYEYNNVSPSQLNGCPGLYYSHAITETFTRSNCQAGYQGGDVTYSVTGDKYTSIYSQADADAQAETEILANGQANADANGSCSQIFYNDLKSVTDSTESCPVGKKGGFVTYSVPANRYSSIVSKADANQKAQDELDANAQSYANDTAHAVCTVDTSPDWVSNDGAVPTCETQFSPASLTGYQIVTAHDQNPNSATYNQTQARKIGLNTTACPMPCYETDANKWTLSSVSILATGSTVSFSMVAYQEGTFNFSSPVKICHYSNATGGPSGCYPTTTKSATVIESGRTWTVTVDSTGNVYIKLVSGTSPPSGTTGSSLIYLSFSITI